MEMIYREAAEAVEVNILSEIVFWKLCEIVIQRLTQNSMLTLDREIEENFRNLVLDYQSGVGGGQRKIDF